MQNLLKTIESNLIEKIKNGNTAAFEELFDSYWENLYRKAYYRLQNQELAEDIVQDVFTAFWEQRETLCLQSGVSNYLYSMLKYKIIYLASQQKRQDKMHAHLFLQMEEIEETILGAMEAGALQNTITQVIDTFPENMRQIFLFRMEDYTIAEIAQALQLAEQTVKNNHTEALKRIRGKLVQEYPHLPIYSLITILFTKT